MRADGKRTDSEEIEDEEDEGGIDTRVASTTTYVRGLLQLGDIMGPRSQHFVQLWTGIVLLSSVLNEDRKPTLVRT